MILAAVHLAVEICCAAFLAAVAFCIVDALLNPPQREDVRLARQLGDSLLTDEAQR